MLSILDSYRYQFTVEIAESDGETSMTANGAFIKEPLTEQLVLKTVDSKGTIEVVQLVHVHDITYLYNQAQDGWVAMPFTNTTSGKLDLINLVLEESAKLLREEIFDRVSAHETVAGIDCSHYHTDARYVPTEFWRSPLRVEGGDVDVWVDNDRGYIVRLLISAKGVDQTGRPSSREFKLALSDVNQPLQITPPPEDEIVQLIPPAAPASTAFPDQPEGIAETLPKPEDATQLRGITRAQTQALVKGTDFTFYRTKLSIEQAAQFFASAYPQAGWEAWKKLYPSEQMALLLFTQETMTANVMLSKIETEHGCIVIVYVE
jgi:hypothetical protein